MNFPCIGNYTISCSAYNTGTLITTILTNATVSGQPTISITQIPSSSICIGASGTVICSGASTYTLLQTNQTGSAVVLSPTVSTCYILAGNTGGGLCTATVPVCFTVNTSPTLSVSGSTTACSNSSVTWVASGANSYTWVPGNLVSPTYNIPTNIIGPACYTLVGTSSTSCTSVLFPSVNVIPSPTISVSGPTVVCANSTLVLTASSGPLTYTWIIPGGIFYSSSIIATPTVAANYSVVGTGSNGCISNQAVQLVFVNQSPTLNITSSTSSVCLGTSVTYTASGANSYSWSTGALSNTMNNIPATNTDYSVIASQTINACQTSSIVSVLVSTACADVWPGDANSD